MFLGDFMAQAIQNNREKQLLHLLQIGLQVYADKETKTMLGKRQNYVGLSDIGKYAECPRQAVLQKIKPMQKDFSEMLILQRGHWFEEGIGKALQAIQLNYLTQLEINIEFQGVPIIAHLDFTLIGENNGKKIVRILEIKSVSDLPTIPRTAHFYQVHGQVGFLYENWNKPVFSLKNSKGEYLYQTLTFPELCKKHFGILLSDTPKDIDLEAWLLCLSMKEGKAFGPYMHNQYLMHEITNFAQNYWQDMHNFMNKNSLLQTAKGFYPLCDFCSYINDCPKFQSTLYQPEYENILAELLQLKEEKKILDNKIKVIETNIKQVYSLAKVTDWIQTNSHRFRLTITNGRKTLNREMLTMELEKLFQKNNIALAEIEGLLTRSETVSEPSSRLTIQTIKE